MQRAKLKLRRVPGTSRHEKSTRVSISTDSHDASVLLDASTSKLLKRASQFWQVSKSEAVRRALEEGADLSPDPEPKLSPIEALEELRRRLNLTPAKAIEWQKAVRDSRR